MNTPHIPADTVRVIPVIQSTIGRKGKGVPDDPIRVITRYFSLDGEPLAEVDPCKGSPEDMEVGPVRLWHGREEEP
jgi:hypothetical protein